MEERIGWRRDGWKTADEWVDGKGQIGEWIIAHRGWMKWWADELRNGLMEAWLSQDIEILHIIAPCLASTLRIRYLTTPEVSSISCAYHA